MSIIFIVIIFSISMFLFKKRNKTKITNNQSTTTGIVVKVFNRGKLPFCKFEYKINETSYFKIQAIPKSYQKEILHQSYQVIYESNNPKNAIIQFN